MADDEHAADRHEEQERERVSRPIHCDDLDEHGQLDERSDDEEEHEDQDHISDGTGEARPGNASGSPARPRCRSDRQDQPPAPAAAPGR